MIIENQTTIARPAEDVFAFVADPRNDPKWHTDVREYTPPQRVVFDGQMGTMTPTVTFTVEPDGAGARFTRRVQIPPRGLLRILAPLISPMARKEADRFLANLKRELENR